MSDEAAREVPPSGAAAAEEGRPEAGREGAGKNTTDQPSAKANSPPAGAAAEATSTKERAKPERTDDKPPRPSANSTSAEKKAEEPTTDAEPATAPCSDGCDGRTS